MNVDRRTAVLNEQPKLSTFLLFGFLLSLILASCNILKNDGNPDGNPVTRRRSVPLSSLKLSLTNGCDQLKNYIAEALFERYTSQSSSICINCFADLPIAPAVGEAGAVTDQMPDDVSRTNIQEEGVDEADLVKVDQNGNLYIANGRFFIVEKGFPSDQLTELSRIDLEANAFNLYLDEPNKRVVIFAQTYKQEAIQSADLSAPGLRPPRVPVLHIIFVDVENPAQSKIVERTSIEGYLLNSRRIDSRIHIVSRFKAPTPPELRQKEFLDLVQKLQE
jgi:uncharacterized secreted protein with C-terminal beta-propeller domain